jgi:hypothetical protein
MSAGHSDDVPLHGMKRFTASKIVTRVPSDPQRLYLWCICMAVDVR